MAKRSLSLVAILLFMALPYTAHGAWTLNTWVKSAGGTIVVRGGTPQTSANGSVFKTYTTTKPMTVTVNANAGYRISALTYNNVVQALPVASPQSYTVQGPTAQNVYATFLPQVMAVSATSGAGGSVSPSGSLANVYYGTQSPARAFTFSPNSGNSVIAITVNGSPLSPSDANLTYTLTNAVTGAAVTLPAARDVKVKLSVSKITYDIALAGTFVSAVANAGPTQTVEPGSLVTLNGSGSTGAITSYTWTQSGGPATVTLSGANTVNATFTPTVAGTYQFQLVVGNGTTNSAPSFVMVYVTSNPLQAARNQCQNCHGTNGVGAATNVFGNWSSSVHRANSVTCAGCHVGANTGGHPGPSRTALRTICLNCHFNGDRGLHPYPLAADAACVPCHEPHSVRTSFNGPPHYNYSTSGMYPASYVTKSGNCRDCHSTAANNLGIRQQWGGSAHGDTRDLPWIAKDFKTINGCVRCHTTTGFVSYSTGKVTGAWGVATDYTKEVLTCRGCHRPDFTVRALAPYSSATAFTFRVDAGNVVTVSYKNSDYATSNICLRCHTGTTSGEIVKRAARFAGFTAAGRALNHFMVGGGFMDNNIGFEFDGTPLGNYQTFNKQNTWHAGIGLPSTHVDTGSGGPCIACHMRAPGAEHSYNAVFKNATGTIAEVATRETCDKCHPSVLGGGDQMTATFLKTLKANFASGLLALKAQLARSGFDPDGAPPQSWGATERERANNMGAWYNYFLLKTSDVGAYAHNPTYAKRLLQYSLDWLDNNTFDDSVAATLGTLNLPPADANRVLVYLEMDAAAMNTNCYLCHQDYYR